MGWGTSFTADMYISRELFRSEGEVQDKINELTESIDRTKRRLALMIAANPETFLDKSKDSDPLYELDNRINDYLELFEEDLIHRYRLQLLLDNWKNKELDEL